jgi:hypothetical protein
MTVFSLDRGVNTILVFVSNRVLSKVGITTTARGA